MSINEEKKFVMKHTFIDVKKMAKRVYHSGKEETHFKIPWRIFIHSCSPTAANVHFQCLKMKGDDEWTIDAIIKSIIYFNSGSNHSEYKLVFSRNDMNLSAHLNILTPLDAYLFDGNLTVECHVTIHKTTGIQQLFVNRFDTNSAKECSDTVLKVNDQKFYVYKMYLSYHSTYFKSLFLGNFDESKQSEVELKDIEPEDFQNFLKVIYAMPDINDETVAGILQLADMYDAQAPIQQCEKFLLKDSEKNFKEKFLLAAQYKLENLKKKCIPEFNTFNDIAAVVPENSRQFDTEVWKELLNLALTFGQR